MSNFFGRRNDGLHDVVEKRSYKTTSDLTKERSTCEGRQLSSIFFSFFLFRFFAFFFFLPHHLRHVYRHLRGARCMNWPSLRSLASTSLICSALYVKHRGFGQQSV